MIDGKRIRELRKSNGYSREKFAELIGIGTTQAYRYEAGASDATGEIISRIATLFGVTTDYLLGLSDNPLGYDNKLTAEEMSIINSIRKKQLNDAMRTILNIEPETA